MYTFTIGIPAYNEENTIQHLLKSISPQIEDKNYVVKKIIVISDGSDDLTVERAWASANEIVEVIDDTRRLGKSARINQIIQQNTSDYIILIDADTVLTPNCLPEVAATLQINDLDFFSCEIQPRENKSIFQKSINASVSITQNISKIWNNGDNVLACHGAFIGIKYNLAKKISLPSTIGNDAYLYFFLKKLGGRFGYCKSAKVLYSTPKSFRDYFNQSVRFQKSKQKMLVYFGNQAANNYKVPLKVLFLSFFSLKPKTYIFLFLYVLTQPIIHIKKLLNNISYKDDLWTIAKSTK